MYHYIFIYIYTPSGLISNSLLLNIAHLEWIYPLIAWWCSSSFIAGSLPEATIKPGEKHLLKSTKKEPKIEPEHLGIKV